MKTSSPIYPKELDLLRGRLRDSVQEEAFQRSALAERQRQYLILLLCIGVISLFSILPDTLALAARPNELRLNSGLSIGFALYSLLLAYASTSINRPKTLNIALGCWWLAAILVICIGNSSYPSDTRLFLIFDILIPVAIYLLFPIGLATQGSLALLFTGLDLSLLLQRGPLPATESAFIAIAFFSAHVIGLATCWHLHISQRQQFLQNQAERQQRKRAEQLLEEVQTLRGILPICSYCKQIRDDQGYWHSVEVYIEEHSESEFTHGICPDCLDKRFPNVRESGQEGEAS